MIRYMYKIGYSAGEWYSQYLVTYDFAPDPCWISFYMMQILLYFLLVYSMSWGVNSWKIFPRSCNWACTLRNPCCGGWKISVGRLLLNNLLVRNSGSWTCQWPCYMLIGGIYIGLGHVRGPIICSQVEILDLGQKRTCQCPYYSLT